LYPENSEDFGINLGAMASRGERGALIISLDSLLRVSSTTRFFLILSNELNKASLQVLNSWAICEGYIDMCEKDAGAEGFRAAKDETHP
jgi:hypothetical protein